jgi:uncharacterized protein (TIGR00730 family)
MTKHYSFDQGMIDDHIMNLIQICGGSPNADLIKEMIMTALKLVDQPADRGEIKILNAAIRELRYAFKLFSRYRDVRKVTVFGSARTLPEEPAYRQALEFSRKITDHGYMVITGAGDGIMKGAQEGAGRQMSFGVNIRLPFEQVANVFIENDPKLVTFKYFFTRKLVFMKEADAIALFPGGYGTLDEAFEALTLMQTGKGDILPIVMVDVPGMGYWEEWKRYLDRQLFKQNLVSEEDESFFKITGNIDEAVEEILTFYRNYHSSRYVRDKLVIRLQRPVPDPFLDKLNAEFKDILSGGEIERASMFPDESNEPELAHLPRLAMAFNRRSFGRLRRMIDLLNTIHGS